MTLFRFWFSLAAADTHTNHIEVDRHRIIPISIPSGRMQFVGRDETRMERRTMAWDWFRATTIKLHYIWNVCMNSVCPYNGCQSREWDRKNRTILPGESNFYNKKLCKMRMNSWCLWLKYVCTLCRAKLSMWSCARWIKYKQNHLPAHTHIQTNFGWFHFHVRICATAVIAAVRFFH